MLRACSSFFFFFNDTATTEIYTLSLHDALPISEVDGSQEHPGLVFEVADHRPVQRRAIAVVRAVELRSLVGVKELDRKSTRLNSSHGYISYAVFCLKKKKKIKIHTNVDVLS